MLKKNICSVALVGAVLFSGSYAHADFDYNEHHYATYNTEREDVSRKDAYLASIPELKNSIPANDYILELQKVAANANGLKIGTYKNNGDYKRIVQPVRLDNSNNSANFGNYQIILGLKSLDKEADYQIHSKNRTPQMDASIIWEMGHEMGHGVLNHGTGKHDRIEEQERDADRIAWYTLEKTSDFGWGYAFNVDTAYRTDNCNEEYVKKQTNNKLWIHGWDKHNVVYELNVSGRWHDVREFYNAIAEFTSKDISIDSAYNDYTIALGQLGYIYSKEKTIDISKLDIVAENKYTYKKSKLIYRSPKMPNGYKTIAFFNSSADAIKGNWGRNGYSLEDLYKGLNELQNTSNNTIEEWEKVLITSIKFAGIDMFNGQSPFDI